MQCDNNQGSHCRHRVAGHAKSGNMSGLAGLPTTAKLSGEKMHFRRQRKSHHADCHDHDFCNHDYHQSCRMSHGSQVDCPSGPVTVWDLPRPPPYMFPPARHILTQFLHNCLSCSLRECGFQLLEPPPRPVVPPPGLPPWPEEELSSSAAGAASLTRKRKMRATEAVGTAGEEGVAGAHNYASLANYLRTQVDERQPCQKEGAAANTYSKDIVTRGNFLALCHAKKFDLWANQRRRQGGPDHQYGCSQMQQARNIEHNMRLSVVGFLVVFLSGLRSSRTSKASEARSVMSARAAKGSITG